MARSVCKSPGPGVADRFHHPPDPALEYCRTNCESRAVDGRASHGEGLLTPTTAALEPVETLGLGRCDAGGKPKHTTHTRDTLHPPAARPSIHLTTIPR